ncbi:MAG: peptidoglycan-binding protein [Treponema sp.]|nr:peptidoglycan-binding protein [Treponema sp.]
MNCSKILNIIYNENPISFVNQLQIGLHTFFCQECAGKIEQYETAMTSMKQDFFQTPPNLEDTIMTRIEAENEQIENQSISGILSTRGWVISGLILMVSLITAFFGFEFRSLASESGMSFLLPMGITIGIILTIYGALFIGSHLDELSERFGL